MSFLKGIWGKKYFNTETEETLTALLLDDLFSNFRHQSEKKIRMLPEIDGLSKDTVVTSWMAKYDALMKGKLSILLIQTYSHMEFHHIACLD